MWAMFSNEEIWKILETKAKSFGCSAICVELVAASWWRENAQLEIIDEQKTKRMYRNKSAGLNTSK